jgi:hypothetical protein
MHTLGDMKSVLLALTVAVALAVPGLAAEAPVLAGPWASGQRGYGHVRPTTIYNGGDPSGLITHTHWRSWGGARAIGDGLGWWVGPHQDEAEGRRESVRVVAFQLGSCHGRRAYDAIEWYFPRHGQRFLANEYIQACTGEYHVSPR